MEINDSIRIYDLSGKYVDYSVYNKVQVNANDISITNQETNQLKKITLITCNNFGTKRTVIQALEQKKE